MIQAGKHTKELLCPTLVALFCLPIACLHVLSYNDTPPPPLPPSATPQGVAGMKRQDDRRDADVTPVGYYPHYKETCYHAIIKYVHYCIDKR